MGGMEIETHLSGHIRGQGSVRDANTADAVLARLAGRQHGVVAAWQLRELGVSQSWIETRLRRGSLLRVYRGVYAVGHAAITWEGRLMAAVLACGPDAVLSHRSAAQLWGLMPRRSIAVELTRPRRAKPLPTIAPHVSPLQPDEVEEAWGIPVTSVARTMLDIAPLVDERGLERAWNEMEVRELRDPVGVEAMVVRHPGKRGIARVRKVMYSTKPAGRTRNELEERFVRLVDDYGLPRPRINAHLALRERFFEIDALWPAERLAVELDGGAAHGTRRAFHRDRERDRVLLAEGYRTARVTWDQMRDEPALIAADLRSALAAGVPGRPLVGAAG